MRKKFTCYRCGKYVETEMDDNGDATCPACENVIDLEPERRFQTRIASLESQLADAQARLAGYEWIPVSERLPEENVEVLVWDYLGSFYIAEHIPSIPQWNTANGAYLHGASYKRVTHWMPLPEAPKEDE